LWRKTFAGIAVTWWTTAIGHLISILFNNFTWVISSFMSQFMSRIWTFCINFMRLFFTTITRITLTRDTATVRIFLVTSFGHNGIGMIAFFVTDAFAWRTVTWLTFAFSFNRNLCLWVLIFNCLWWLRCGKLTLTGIGGTERAWRFCN